MKYDAMIRTQVYLSRVQKQALKSHALISRNRKNKLIRKVISLLLSKGTLYPTNESEPYKIRGAYSRVTECRATYESHLRGIYVFRMP